jgi:hypothetical protein
MLDAPSGRELLATDRSWPVRSLASEKASGWPAGVSSTAKRLRAWRYQGVVVLKPEEIVDPWVRQALVNEAVRRHGPRPGARR